MKLLKSILLIDDDSDDNFFHERAIKAADVAEEIMIAENGFQALNLLKKCERQPDLILLDLNMPKMNGWEFLEEYERYFNNASSTIIILTTSLNPDDRERSKQIYRIKDFRTKPLNSEMMMDILQRFFSNKERS